MLRHTIEIAYASLPERDGWVEITAAPHPQGGEWGMVIRNTCTGLYAMDSLGSIRSVPQSWARQLDTPTTEET